MTGDRKNWLHVVTPLLVGLLSIPALGEWEVFFLNPEAPDNPPGSYGSATFHHRHGGSVRVGDADCLGATPHAAIWQGTSTDWIDLNPAGASYSSIYAIDGDDEAGIVRMEGENRFHSALWSGSAESFIDLNPAGASESYVLGMGGDEQAGIVWMSSPPHAAIWRGSAESFVSLHPAGLDTSVATDTNGMIQVGRTRVDQVFGYSHAAMWRGSPQSWVDLHPADAAEHSNINAVSTDGNEQVGSVDVEVGEYIDTHAALWHGSPVGWMDLNPPGAIFSTLRDTDGTYQCGQAYATDGVYYTYRAYIWKGSLATRVDLHALLPGEYTMSEAEGVYSDGQGVWVFGYAHRVGVQCDRAILWHLANPCPADITGDGLVNIADLLELLARWGGEHGGPADINGDTVVNVLDLLQLLAAWGPCEP
jgi:hypothetical protein